MSLRILPLSIAVLTYYLVRRRRRKRKHTESLPLDWVYGGFKGAAATHSGVTIRNLVVHRDRITFDWETDLSAWGIKSADDHSKALACLFVKRSDGAWVGGKFDWISTSRAMRELKHIHQGYGGWSLAGVPNPCEVAFVVAHTDARRRSNILTSIWRR